MLPYIFGQAPAAYLVALPIFLLAASGVLSILFGNWRRQSAVACVLLAASAASAFYIAASGASYTFLYILQANAFSGLMFGVMAIGLLLIEIISYKQQGRPRELGVLLSFVALGVFLVAFAYSIISILVGIEVVILATAFMILLNGKRYVEPSLKLFLLGAIATAAMTFALALLFRFDPTLALVQAAAPATFILGLSFVMFIAAFSIEAAATPFNFWVPDVYEGSPGNITALLAGVNKKVAFIALLEIFVMVYGVYRATPSSMLPLASDIFFAIAVLTMFFGNLAALVQKNVKRLFAYSSISQAGYIFIGISAATHMGIESSIFYIVAHTFMIIGAFSIVFWLEQRNISTMDEYSGLAGRNMFAAVALSILMLSMAGIPPLIGFAGKFLLFSSALGANDPMLAFLGIINSFISIFYYAKVINQMFLRKEEKSIAMDRNIAIAVGICLIVVIFVGIYPQVLLGAASAAASALGV